MAFCIVARRCPDGVPLEGRVQASRNRAFTVRHSWPRVRDLAFSAVALKSARAFWGCRAPA
eukprot:11219456-Lingulodinium_polyedra.AAC.1